MRLGDGTASGKNLDLVAPGVQQIADLLTENLVSTKDIRRIEI